MSASTVDSTIALVTLEHLKEYLGITGSSDDALLAAIINGISQRVHDHCQRYLLSKSYTHYFSGGGNRTLLLAMSPVTSVTSVHDDTLREFGAATLVAAADRLVERSGLMTCINDKVAWGRGVLNVKVVYTAGWSLAALPASLSLAVKEFCAAAYYKAKNRRHDVQSESLGDKTITYLQVAMPATVEAALAPYVHVHTGADWAEAI